MENPATPDATPDAAPDAAPDATRAVTPIPPAAPQPTRGPAKPELLGSWADPTDVADRYAMEQARREAEGERPPHY